MTPSIFQRHPRYVVASCVGFLVILLLQTGTSGSSVSFARLSSRYSDVPYKLQRSEEVYQRTLPERAKLIRQYGPTKDDVLCWPIYGQYYTLWDFFTPAFNCPHETERIGALGDGGKWVCGLSKIAPKKKCVIYSFGINDESSFEAALLERTQNCEIWGYDFSVGDFGPEVRNIPSLKERSHFQAWGLAGKDDPHSDPPMYTIQSLMKMNGHTFIDLLKIDVEGYEFPALDSFIQAFKGQSLPIGQLQIEIHADRQPGVTDDQKRFSEFLKWWENLEDAGLRPFWTEPNLVYVNIVRGSPATLSEYSFINIKADHDLLH